jgi:trigger factor
LDDDLAMMVGDYDTLEELRIGARQGLEAEALQNAESDYLEQATEAMRQGAVKFEYPVQAVDREAEAALQQMEQNLASSGIDLDTYLGMIGKTRAAYIEDLRPSAEQRLVRQLVFNAVAQAEGLKIEDEEIEAEINRLVEQFSEFNPEQGDEMRAMLDSASGKLSVASDLMGNKVQERIIQIGKGEAPELEVEPEVEDTEEETEAEVTDEPEEPGKEPDEELRVPAEDNPDESGDDVANTPEVAKEKSDDMPDLEEDKG